PAPFTPLAVEEGHIKPWGRDYAFSESGLLQQVDSQGQAWTAGAMELQATIQGQTADVQVTQPWKVTGQNGAVVTAQSELRAGNLVLTLESTTEFDGLVRYRLRYAPCRDSAPVALDRLRLRVPISGKLARFYS